MSIYLNEWVLNHVVYIQLLYNYIASYIWMYISYCGCVFIIANCNSYSYVCRPTAGQECLISATCAPLIEVFIQFTDSSKLNQPRLLPTHPTPSSEVYIFYYIYMYMHVCYISGASALPDIYAQLPKGTHIYVAIDIAT